MKNSKTCLKCSSKNIAKVKSEGYGGLRIATTWCTSALASYYVCCDCGYTESWVESKDDLKKIKKQYINKN